ncbi:MAG: universal stress protein [Burkholderiaceae bacterium]
MPGTHTILSATDFSDYARIAERRAAMLARDHACPGIELLTVKETAQTDVLAQIMNTSFETAAEAVRLRMNQALQERAASLKDEFGIACTLAVRIGMPAREIVARAEEIAADLVVAGAHGGGFFSKLLLGDTTTKLAQLCKRPLLVVKSPADHAYRHVLVPIDFSEDSHRAAQLAMQIAPGAAITFLHAYEVWYEGALQFANVDQDSIDIYRFKEQEHARRAMKQFITEIGASDLPAGQVIEFGMPTTVIRDYAKKHKPDLIVMGKHGRSHLEELLLGSVTHAALEQTNSDVLVVPLGSNPA